MHGKTGSPLSTHLPPLYAALSSTGYDVVAPYMPWNGLDWDGSMCEGINYIDSLAVQQAANGRNVIVAGHSMGGAHALIHGATEPAGEIKAIVTLAPGHFPHLSNNMQTVTAASVALAESMVASGNGDDIATFDILNSGVTIQITASANDYLSFHVLDQYPDINDVLPVISVPVLWLAGDLDPITTGYDMATLFTRITSVDSEYQVASGDHKGMVANSEAPIINWLASLGL
jgi:pimeloyl-ACP methyl ester carboxylesterase